MPRDHSPFRSFSEGADRFFDRIRPYGGEGAAYFPPGLRSIDARRRANEPLWDWFRRIVAELGADAPESFAIEENIGLLAKVKWTTGATLIYANIQVVVAEKTLVEYWCDAEHPAFYLRLDCDENTLSDPFSHPHPHVHLDGRLSPRFALDGGTSANVVVDFVEFLYRHYLPKGWEAWATRVWNRDRDRRAIGPDGDALPRIIEAFRDNRPDSLRRDRTELTRLKDLLRHAKDDQKAFTPLRLDPADRELLEYPSAR